jgi:hypothetical protein
VRRELSHMTDRGLITRPFNRRDVIIESASVLANPKRASASKRLAPRRLVEAPYPPKPNLFLSAFRFEHFTHSAARNSFAIHGIAPEDDFGV